MRAVAYELDSLLLRLCKHKERKGHGTHDALCLLLPTPTTQKLIPCGRRSRSSSSRSSSGSSSSSSSSNTNNNGRKDEEEEEQQQVLLRLKVLRRPTSSL